MKRAAVWLLLLFIPAVAVAQSHPVFTTAAQEAVYAQMKTDYEANPTSPATYGGRFYRYIKNSADLGVDNSGLAAAWMYHVTGTATYATAAYGKLSSWLALPDGLVCGNTSADSYVLRVLIYDWIYPGLSAGNRTTFLNKLNTTANFCTDNISDLAILKDTDRTIGDYFGTAMLYVATTSYNSTINTYWSESGRKLGGLVAEAADWTDRRNTVRAIVETLWAGGEPSESSGYNMYTNSILMLAYWALDVVGGTNNFPEITAWLSKGRLAWVAAVSPDFKMNHQWGDDQETSPRQVTTFYRLDTSQCFAGLTQSDTAFQDWFLDFVDSLGGFATAANGSRTGANGANPWFKCAPIWNPYATRGDRTTIATAYWSDDPVGIVGVRTGWGSSSSWLVSSFPYKRSVNGVEMMAHRGRQWGDFQFWKNNKWAITHPIGYDGPTTDPRGTGTILYPIGPIGSWLSEYGGARAFTDDGDFLYIAGTQGGSFIWDTYYNPPPTKLMEDSRSIVWLKAADMVVVHSRTNIDDPRPCPSNYDPTFAAWCTAQTSLKKLPIHTPVSPTVNSPTIDWTYSAGESVRVTHLLPASVTMTIVNETTEWANAFFRGYNNADELRFHVAIRPTVDQKWDTFLDVWDVHTGTPRTATLVQDTTNDADAVFIAATGQNYLVAFNAIRGADLPQPPNVAGRASFTVEHRAAIAAILDTVRRRTTSLTLAYTAASNSTKAIICDLDPGTTWTYRVNGGAEQPLTVNSDGVGEADIATTGAVTLVVLAGGAEPPVPVTIATASFPSGRLNTAYSQTATATGGNGGPYTWTKTLGSLPTSTTLSGGGTISGTPSAAGLFTFTLQACDSTPTCGTRELTITIADLPSITTTSLANGTAGSAYNQTVAGTGGTAPYAWTVHDGSLCAGLGLNSGSGAITGTPITVQSCTFTIRLTDDGAATADKTFTINIAAVIETAKPEVWVDVQAYRAVVNYRLTGLYYGTSCTVNLYDDTVGVDLTPVADTATQTVGLARRSAAFTNLDSNRIYSAIVSCTSATPADRLYFKTLDDPAPGDRTIAFSLRPSAIIPSAARVTVDWDWDTTFAAPTSTQNTGCSTGCTVSVSFPQQGVFYYRWRWQDVSNNVLATSSIRPIVIP